MMFFKSKPHTEKLDKTLTTKLDKIFQYFKAKEEPFEWLFARNHKVAPMAIATYWHYGKANLDESELLNNYRSANEVGKRILKRTSKIIFNELSNNDVQHSD